MNVSWKEYDAMCWHREKYWALQDNIFYGLCKRYPRHDTADVVYAKLSIIGRAYSTGIERKIESRGGQGSALIQLGDFFLKHGREVDDILQSVSGVKEPLTPEKLKLIVSAHGRLVRLLQKRLRKQQSPRSFVSKYMHFHCPAVPVYDNFASSKLRSLVKWNRSLEVFHLPKGADADYYRFALRFYQFYLAAKAARKNVTVKRLDYFLCQLAGQA